MNDKKKKMLVILITLLIVMFGAGLFLFLRFAKNNVLENKVIKIGSTVDNDINNYIKNNKNCKLDISEVDNTKEGKYVYYIKCPKKTFKGNIEVKK